MLTNVYTKDIVVSSAGRHLATNLPAGDGWQALLNPALHTAGSHMPHWLKPQAATCGVDVSRGVGPQSGWFLLVWNHELISNQPGLPQVEKLPAKLT